MLQNKLQWHHRQQGKTENKQFSRKQLSQFKFLAMRLRREKRRICEYSWMISLSVNWTATNKLTRFFFLSHYIYKSNNQYIERYIYERGCLKAGESLFEENIFYVVGTSILLMITKVYKLYNRLTFSLRFSFMIFISAN